MADSSDSESAGSGGTKRTSDGRPKKPSPEALEKFMKSDASDFIKYVTEAHKEDATHPAYPCAAASLVRAVATLRDVPMGEYMANLASENFRYYMDPTAKKDGCIMLLQHDGALWTDKAHITENNMDAFTRTATIRVVETLLAAIPPPDEDAEDEGVHFGHVRSQLTNLRLQLDSSPYLNKVRKVMRAFMQTSEFYEKRNLIAPEKFFRSLDSNGMLLGFNNGVLNMQEPDASFKFYPRGKVPPNFIVSLSVGYDYPKGCPDVWPANAFPNFHAAVRAAMERAEGATINKVFFNHDMYDAATLVFGSLFFGGNQAKKLYMLLGPGGDNGKSILLFLIQQLFGDYYGTLNRFALIERKHDADPGGTTSHLVETHKLRVVAISEAKKNESLDRSNVTSMTGGDEIPMRGLWGRAFAAEFLATLLYVANFAPIMDGADGPLMARNYGLSCDAKFAKGSTDNPQTGVWAGRNPAEVKADIKQDRNALLLLFLTYARRFADAGFQLPPAPAGSATEAIQEGASGTFDTWFIANYESTLKANSNQIDWSKYEERGAIRLVQLIASYKDFSGKVLTTKDAHAALKRLGFAVGKVISDKLVGGSYNDGVKACEKGTAEPPSAGDGAA